jgi:hypothetical protein
MPPPAQVSVLYTMCDEDFFCVFCTLPPPWHNVVFCLQLIGKVLQEIFSAASLTICSWGGGGWEQLGNVRKMFLKSQIIR